MKNKIIVIGAGAWGTALASLLSSQNKNVCLITNNKEVADEINQKHSNHNFLPDIALSYNLKSSQDLKNEIIDADFVFVVTPSNATIDVLQKIASLQIKSNCGIIICSKGLDSVSLKFFHQIIGEILPQKNYATLSGPTFAAEVASGEPTITTIAAHDQNFAKEVSGLLQNDFFKVEISSDVVAAELCGIIKNIMAIGCGLVDGLGFGQNTKAALVLQGIREIKILCQKFGSAAEINNAAGFGDIFLTCASTKSRNNSLGSMIASGKKPSELLNGKKTYEGAINAKAVKALAAKLSVKLPLCEIVSYILQNDLAKDEMKKQIVAAIFGKAHSN